MPTLEKISRRASLTDTESISLRGIASGKFVARSIKVSKYLCPDEDEGLIGPTISIFTLLKGSEIIGVGSELKALVLVYANLTSDICHMICNNC